MGLKAWANTNGTVWTAPSGSIVTSLVDHDNPLGIRPYTMRFQFSDYSYDPTSESWMDGSYWTQVSSSPNVWDYTHVSSSWTRSSGSVETTGAFGSRFQDRGNLVTVLGGNLLGVTDIRTLFYRDTALLAVNSIDTSTVTSISNLFYSCTALGAIPAMDLSSCNSTVNSFAYCQSITSAPTLDFSKVTDAASTFYYCSNLV